jgi:hypothetical protein
MGQTTFTGPVISQNGFIDSSFTNAERDAIVDPQPGLLIYNTDENAYQVCTVGGPQPTWDSAFSGGGGGAGGFPYVFSSLSTPANTWGSGVRNSVPVLFSPNGLQATTVALDMGMIVNVTNLANPFDLNSQTGSTSLPQQYIGQWVSIGSFFNGNGSQYTYLATDSFGNSTVYYAVYNLNANYDMTSANFVGSGTVGTFGLGMGDIVTSACLSPDGTKIIFGGSSNMAGTSFTAESTLSTPYQIDTIQTGATQNVTSLIQNYAGSNGLLRGLAFNPAGTVAYISILVYGMPSILEFNLGTPYDLLSQSQAYTSEFYPPATMSPNFQSYNWGLTVVGNSEKLVVGFQDSGQPYYATATLQGVVAPNITGVSPSSGEPLSSVTITGTGFIGTLQVTFGGFGSSFTVNSNTQITATVPPDGSGTVDVQVFNPAGTSTEVGAFTYPAGPTTYTQGVNYSTGGVQASNVTLLVISSDWFSPTEFNNVISKTAGSFSVFYTGTGTQLTGTLTSGFTEINPGVYSANVNLPGAFFGSPANCGDLTI